MLPLFWRNNAFRNEMHGYSISFFICYYWIMIIFLIWYLFLYSIFHSICNIIKIHSKIIIIIFKIKVFWIFILIILPFFRYLYSIIPKIITNSMSFIIFSFWIKLILIIWYDTLFSLFKYMNLILC